MYNYCSTLMTDVNDFSDRKTHDRFDREPFYRRKFSNFLNFSIVFLHYHLGQFCSDVDGYDIDDGDGCTTLFLGLFRWFP